ncbi:phosphatase PAP2 family protein [Streptomyces griseorubiginosus]|uniref:phosphatase PAP2 family protein n=1 Tax=Streptomyces griseorubiginosus TaxID=67304 RepID=UPI001AD70EDE|nr:phosphatase PAP2 family protein [Streptomyces griseorubiginosus]MBO4252418.1 phosphatase PAP2 family protein [Streptomyces griseorubiginosus]
MRLVAQLRDVERSLTKAAACRIPPPAGKVLSAVEESAESTKLWCAAAAVMAGAGGRRGRTAAAAGLGALAVAQLVSNGLCKQLADRPRPPKTWFPHDEVEDRPDSSSFPSGHTAAAVAFTAAVTPVWPPAGVACALPAAMVALERVQSGAHYPSDVAVGTGIGLASAWLTRSAPRLILRHWLAG